MSCTIRNTSNPLVKHVLIYGETVGKITYKTFGRAGWQFHRHQPVWSNLPPRIALEAESFANEQCAIQNITARLTA